MGYLVKPFKVKHIDWKPRLLTVISSFRKLRPTLLRLLRKSPSDPTLLTVTKQFLDETYHTLVKDTGLTMMPGTGQTGGTDVSQQLECPICGEPVTDRGVACPRTRHPQRFHARCLIEWIDHRINEQQSANCPLCRADFTEAEQQIIRTGPHLNQVQLVQWRDHLYHVREALDQFWTEYGPNIMFIIIIAILVGLCANPSFRSAAGCILAIMFSVLLIVAYIATILDDDYHGGYDDELPNPGNFVSQACSGV